MRGLTTLIVALGTGLAISLTATAQVNEKLSDFQPDIEAARSVGANIYHIIIKVLVPMSRATIAVAIILAFTSTVGTFTLPFMLIGGKVPTTVTVDIAHRVTYFGDYGVANALGALSYLMVLVTAIYYLRYSVKKGIYEAQE